MLFLLLVVVTVITILLVIYGYMLVVTMIVRLVICWLYAGLKIIVALNTANYEYIYIYIAQPVAGLKRELVGRGGARGGRCTARCWKMEKGCADIKIG